MCGIFILLIKEILPLLLYNIKHETLINLEKRLVMNFKEGFSIALNGLCELIANFKIN
jgi:hypothetical protein